MYYVIENTIKKYILLYINIYKYNKEGNCDELQIIIIAKRSIKELLNIDIPKGFQTCIPWATHSLFIYGWQLKYFCNQYFPKTQVVI